MILIPLQTFGIGDVIFTQTLVRSLAKEGDKILWPVESHFVEGLNRAYPDITFIDKRFVDVDYNDPTDRMIGECRILPIRFADQILNVPYSQCMSSKYVLYNMDWIDWKEKAQWILDLDNIEELYGELDLQPNEEYILVNKYFGSDSQLVAPIKIDSPIRQIEMRTIPGFSLFDWAAIICGASIIHTVSTSIFYILEVLSLKAKEIHLYVRKPIETDFRNIDYLFTKNYILHE